MADETFFLGAEGFAEGAPADALLPIGGGHDAPDVEEGDLGHAEAAEGLFEAAAEIGGFGVVGLGGGVEGGVGGRHGADGFAENDFALVVAVVGGGIEVVDAGAARGVEEGDAGVVILGRGQTHAAKTDDGKLFAGAAVRVRAHDFFLTWVDSNG